MSMEFNCCPEPYATITYEFHMTRMSLYYFLYVILPLGAQVFMFLMIFHIPYETGERMGFGVTILLSITVYLLVISEKLPEKSDNRPMLGICFIAEFYLLSTALIMAGMNVMLSRKTSVPPRILTAIHLTYTRLFCTRKEKDNDEPEIIPMCQMDDYPNEEEPISPTGMNGMLMTSLVDGSEPMTGGEHTKDHFMDNNRKWRKICRTLDKIYFYFFVFVIIAVPFIVSYSLNRDKLGI